MTKSHWTRWIMALLAAMALVAAACGEDDGGETEGTEGGTQETEEFPADSTMAKIQEKGEIVIGVKYDVPPFGFLNPQTEEVEGFDVDLGNIIADKLGVEPKFIEAISDNRIPFLQQGRVDIILSTMTITTDRNVDIDYSRPYFVAHGRILVPGNSDIAGIEDLNGTKVCTAVGSTYEATIEKQAPDAELVLVDAYSECFENIQNGTVDAVSTDDVILTGMVIQDDSLQMVGDELTTEPYGVGIPEGQHDLQDWLDQTVEETFESGQWEDLYQEWVGKYRGTDPGTALQEVTDTTREDAYKLFPCDEFCDQVKKNDP